MKKLYVIASLLLLAPMVAQAQEEEGRIESAAEVTIGAQQFDLDPNSAKFNEYRDINDGFNLYDLWLEVRDTKRGLFVDFSGQDLLRDDQAIRFRVGDYGRWNLDINRTEIPHNLSNKAKTPFIDQGDGVYTVPTAVPLSTYDLTPSNAQLNANDLNTAGWLTTHLHDTDLGTQRDKTSATLQYSFPEALKFRVSLADERKDGSKLTYGPIGDRPPRTLNVQLTEPIDYTTQELKLEAEYNRPTCQTKFTYLVSDFENDIDTFRWQNIYATPLAGEDFQTWLPDAYNVGAFGQRALAPDNRYQNTSLAFGVDLPLASRLAATVAYGIMEQDNTLLPYSSSNLNSATDFGSTADLPRLTADGEITTKLLNVDYTINPIERLNLRPFFRYYSLDNDTPQEQWHYITSDTIPTTAGGSVIGRTDPTEVNKRINQAYAQDQINYGLETSYQLAVWRTTLGLGYELEDIDRDFREADTEEDIFKGSIKVRPTDWLSLRAKYLFGDRQGDDYNNTITSASYWFTPGTVGNGDPSLSFNNHPDMRMFDVADRERHQFDISATVNPLESLDLSASYLHREDDFDAGVDSTQPLLALGGGVTAADDTAATPGNQLGLLERQTQRYTLDANYAPSERLTLNAFGSRETIESEQRGLEFNENNKLNPTAVSATAELGPWTRASSQWLAKTDDRTNSIGVGGGYEIIPEKLRLVTDYTVARGTVDIGYSGFGTQSSVTPANTLADNHEFAFRDPETVSHKQYTLNASLEYKMMKNMVVGLHYIFDRYEISDWMQEANQPWFESVGSEYLLRDTSAATTSNQWGNRLVNLGSYLGPGYESHLASVTMTYRF